jgi:hypothetical protein
LLHVPAALAALLAPLALMVGFAGMRRPVFDEEILLRRDRAPTSVATQEA